MLNSFSVGSRKATGIAAAKWAKHSPRAGRCLHRRKIPHRHEMSSYKQVKTEAQSIYESRLTLFFLLKALDTINPLIIEGLRIESYVVQSDFGIYLSN